MASRAVPAGLSARAASATARRRLGGLAALGAVLLGWPLLVDEPFVAHIGTLVLLYCIGASSLHLILRIGHLSQVHTFITDRCPLDNIRAICLDQDVRLMETSGG